MLSALFALALAAAPPASDAAPFEERRPIEQEDLDPTVGVIETRDVDIRLGGFAQIHVVPWAGEDALVENEDVATRAGFRLRRARIGVEARFIRRLRLFLSVNPLESDAEVGTVADARLSYEYRPWLGVTVGTGKVPFSRSALTSARQLVGVERPVSVTQLTPSRRLGVSVEGSVLEGRVAYLASVMNGTEGFSAGNRFGGILYGARVELSAFGPFIHTDPSITNVSLGLSALNQRTPGFQGQAYSVDVTGHFRGFSLQVEGLMDRRAPLDVPVVSPDLPSATERLGAYVEAAYVLPVVYPIQVMARVEWLDDNRAQLDAGDGFLFEGGFNASVYSGHARAQLHYLGRLERSGPVRRNDAVVLSLQGSF